jgi:CheY-like chemotaxis protein
MVRNILFVDDDEILRMALEKSLARYRENFNIVTASDGFDAVKQLKKTAVSLVVLDLIMPRMDGMSLLSHIRENYSDIPCIIVSSIDDSQLQEISKTSGAIGYLKKPFQAERLVATITGILQREAVGGIMNDISPAVFLQFIEMDAKSCTIRIIDNATHQGGIMYFKDGEMLDARIGPLRGIEAAYELFSWDTATIFMRNECDPRENNINSTLTPMIMKAVGMKDEAEVQQQDNIPNSAIICPSDTTRIEQLKMKLGKDLGLKKCYQDVQVDKVAEQLAKLGKDKGLGDFRFAYIDNDENCKIILSGPPPTVLEIAPNCTPDKIINLLINDNQTL